MWDIHVEQLIHEGKFDNEYPMSVAVHSQLVDLLSPLLQRVEYNSRSSSGPILVEHIVAFGIRALAGARLVNLHHIFGTSLPVAYKAFDDFVNAVNAPPEFDIKFPQSEAEWGKVNAEFTAKSSDGIIQGCVGAIDGYFQ